jgi:hypothetical protein
MNLIKFLLPFFICLFFITDSFGQQNTLNNLGLTSSNPASVAFSVRKLSSAYTGPLMRVRVNSDYYDVYPDASADNQISLNSLISAPISYSSLITSASVNNLGTLSATIAYVAIWYDQSGNQNNLSNSFEANQPLIINSNSIITDPTNNKPIIFWDGAVRVLQLQTGVSTNGQVIVVNRFGNTSDRDGFLLGDNTQGRYFWHSDDPAPRMLLFAYYASPEILNGSIFQNGNYKSDRFQTIFNQTLGINSIAPKSPSYQTYWDNIGTERGNTNGSGTHNTTLNAGYSEILSFPTKLNQTLRSGVESNQSAYFGITLNFTNEPGSLLITTPLATLTNCFGASSSPTSFDVSGDNLTASVTISAPSDFEISTDPGGTYSPSLTLTNTTNVSKTIYVRLSAAASVGSITGTITATSSSTTATTTVSGTVYAIPTISILKADLSGITINDGIICNGASATLTASGGSTYLWSTGESTASITKSPTNTTIYTVSGTTSAGCSNITSVTVTVNPIPTISISESDASGSSNNDSKVCIGGIATLTAIGGSTYSWSTLENASLINPSISSNTTYTVTGTTAGCSNTASITITVESLPSLSYNSISLSNESTYLITKTTSVSSDESWSVTGANTVNNGYVTAGTTPGTYTLSYTDGCAKTVSATITVSSTSTLPSITDGLASYKFNNNPQGPLGSGNVIYMGYNGFNYYSTIRPTNTGFYRANNVSGSSAGSPFSFYIYRCTTCPD